MKQIALYGLSRSGKSCYIYGMAKAMADGIATKDSVLSIRTPKIPQQIRLNKGFEELANGKWPLGTVEKYSYQFNCRIGMENVMPFIVQDYRGGLLDTDNKTDEDEQEDIFRSLAEASSVVMFIGGEIVKEAIKGSYDERSKIALVGTFLENFRDYNNDNIPPVTIVITKSDMLTTVDLENGKSLVKDILKELFFPGSDYSVALTSISLGKRLTNNNRMFGPDSELILDPKYGNIHIPILFPLYCLVLEQLYAVRDQIEDIENKYNILNKELRNEVNKNIFQKFFSNNESNIREEISRKNGALSDLQKNMLKLEQQLNTVISTFGNGVEVYYKGQKQIKS